MRIGRRDGCDIVLQYRNVSGHHALMEIKEGYWFIKDLRSRNGIKVDGKRIPVGTRKRLDPEVIFSIARHQFTIRYDPTELGAHGEPPPDIVDKPFGEWFRKSGGMMGVRPRFGPRDYPPLGGHANPPRDDDDD